MKPRSLVRVGVLNVGPWPVPACDIAREDQPPADRNGMPLDVTSRPRPMGVE